MLNQYNDMIDFLKAFDTTEYKESSEYKMNHLRDLFRQCEHLKKVFRDQQNSTSTIYHDEI